MSKLLKEVGRGYARGGVVLAISTVIMFSLFCVLICLPLWLVTRQDAPMWILILSGGILLLLLFGSIPVVLIGAYQSRKKRLDEIFLPLGLEGSRYQIHFRRYHGLVDGQELAIRFYRGPVLEIEIITNIETSLVVSQTRPSGLTNLIGQSPIPTDDPALGDAKIYTRDEDFAYRLLQHPEVPQKFATLTTPQENFVYRHLIFRSGKLILMSAFSSRLFGFDLDPDAARSWVNEVIALKIIAESSKAPTIHPQTNLTE